jgi:hypothetical protein
VKRQPASYDVTSPPREEVWLSVFGHGFIGLQNRVVRATEAETIITLSRTLRVTGTVVDVRTRKPIESFTLTPGYEVSFRDGNSDAISCFPNPAVQTNHGPDSFFLKTNRVPVSSSNSVTSRCEVP